MIFNDFFRWSLANGYLPNCLPNLDRVFSAGSAIFPM